MPRAANSSGEAKPENLISKLTCWPGKQEGLRLKTGGKRPHHRQEGEGRKNPSENDTWDNKVREFLSPRGNNSLCGRNKGLTSERVWTDLQMIESCVAVKERGYLQGQEGQPSLRPGARQPVPVFCWVDFKHAQSSEC